MVNLGKTIIKFAFIEARGAECGGLEGLRRTEMESSFTGLLEGTEGGDVNIDGRGECSKTSDVNIDEGGVDIDINDKVGGVDINEEGVVDFNDQESEDDDDTSEGDVFYDSDYDLSDDDMLYDKYIDAGVEFTTGTPKGKETMTYVVSKGKEKDMSFNEDDGYTSSDSLSSDGEGVTKSIRTHAVVWQRDISFVKNDDKRVKAKCDLNTIGQERRSMICLMEISRTNIQARFLQGCRPVIGVDGCHLRGSHKGILLTAVRIDPNNCIFPICYCVTEGEDFNTWKWFLELLINDLGIYDQQKWTFVLDRQKGLLPALYELLPDIEHRYCVRHMYNNFKKEHHGQTLKDRMWNIAKAFTVNQFKFLMEKVKEIDEEAHKWMADVLLRHWSISHFRTSPKCDILLNNMCESFNLAILEARSKPLLSMMEGLRIYLMKRMQAKRDTMLRWELSDIPCVHAMSAIMSAGRESEEYVDACYSVETHSKAYGFVVNPINGPSEWDYIGPSSQSVPTQVAPLAVQALKHVVPSSSTQPQNECASANISGVSVKASFIKKGKHCVTLKALQTAGSSSCA
ncbi:hypothetical protein BUALT_Bualt07G0127400 [Buddleja alternifolia]|uniref:MULE transposase domain-containing protein n=1 Tax=Buddleja alternifolia TaxID=168488 RepID=A0AAV6XI26_9LAMI|nr:hypothetical protein BUALT_Bualt07G0127400 [Buddleja alternifolia]